MNKELLKKDVFGEIWKLETRGEFELLRDTQSSRWWLRWLARALLRREASALAVLTGVAGVPQLQSVDRTSLKRSFLPGVALHQGRPDHAAYFKDAARLLRRIHRLDVAHNDLAKEPNLLVLSNGSPAFIDFQLASYAPDRGRLFRIAAREDIRHLLKHKRTYRPDLLTSRERSILESPSLPSRGFMTLIKPIYLFVTRRLIGWSDREGAADR
jgi:RIO-like serine/threonine protein kinase